MTFSLIEPLRFAFSQRAALPYFGGYEEVVPQLLADGAAEFVNGSGTVRWELCLGDFPGLLRSAGADGLPSPHLVQFDPWSPARNPAMWTVPVFADLFRRLDPGRGCLLATYSRSTLIRVGLLLAGFYVGMGLAAGRKEETTLAANQPALLPVPLEARWLERARRSDAAEPLWEPVWSRAPLAPATWERLRAHPQFRPEKP